VAEAKSGTGIEVRISCSLFNVWCEHVKNAAEHSLASIDHMLRVWQHPCAAALRITTQRQAEIAKAEEDNEE